MKESKLSTALRSLTEGGVEFILVGGLAAVLQGAPVQTYDIDIVYSREPENVERLLKFLEETDAIFRAQPERRLRPTESHLLGRGHLNLLTLYGPLDLLTFIGPNLGYPELIPLARKMEIGDGLQIRVLGLETIISIK